MTPEMVEFAAFELARKTMEWNEPIPDFSTRFPNVLESSLKEPFQTFGGKQLYPNLVGKAAVLFYLLIKNHPFQNGNKRLAVTTLLIFLLLNKKWLVLGPKEMYRLAKKVAKSAPEDREMAMALIRETIREAMVSSKKIEIALAKKHASAAS